MVTRHHVRRHDVSCNEWVVVVASLRASYTFSFGGYSNAKFDSFGCLRVINEDRIGGGGGFPSHSHADAEIFTYVIKGSIRHEDSMGNAETITRYSQCYAINHNIKCGVGCRRGGVQFTSAGAGMKHSEFNASTTDLLHLCVLVRVCIDVTVGWGAGVRSG